jgi:hypothetical protein
MRMSLEDIFLSVITDESAEAPPAPPAEPPPAEEVAHA